MLTHASDEPEGLLVVLSQEVHSCCAEGKVTSGVPSALWVRERQHPEQTLVLSKAQMKRKRDNVLLKNFIQTCSTWVYECREVQM